MSQAEIASLRQEVNDISRLVSLVQEVVDIRKEVEAIRKEKDSIVSKNSSEKAAPAAEQPKAAEPAKKQEPAKEQPKPAVQEAPKSQPPQQKAPAASAPPKEQPKAAEPPKKQEPAKEQPKPAAKEEPKPAAKEQAKPAATPAPQAAPVASGEQPPKSQSWNRGELLSTCCADYYQLVRQDNSPTTWVLLKHESNSQVRAEAVGTGGLSEILPHLGEKDTAFAYVRFETGDAESRRSKFVLISWCGPRAPIMRKAKMSVHKADVKEVFASCAVELQASDLDDIDENAILSRLRRAGGANYNGQNS